MEETTKQTPERLDSQPTTRFVVHEEKSVPPILGNVDLNHYLPPKHDGNTMADPVNVSNKHKGGVVDLSWRNAHPTEVPSTYWMRKLLVQVKRDHFGEAPAVRARFKRAFTRGSVMLSHGEWKVLKMPTPDYTPLPLDSYPAEAPSPEEDALHDTDPEPLEAPLSPLSPERTGFTPVKVKNAIDLVYKRLYSAANKNLDHNGSSTYAEITRCGVSHIIEGIMKYFIPKMKDEELAAFRAVDLGGGFLTCLSHIAQVIPGEYVGVEYDELRTWMFARSYYGLLKDHAGDLCNHKIAYIHKDILELLSYDCDLVYTFDEAFPYNVWQHIVRTFCASRRCKFLIMFKVAKSFPGIKAWYQELLQVGGVTLVHKLCLSKKGGEGSTAMFFVKNEHLNPTTCSLHELQRLPDQVWESCRPFWDSRDTALRAISEVEISVSKKLEREKVNRKK
jgi:hypothetical protein